VNNSASTKDAKPKKTEAVRESKSFAMNIFRGQINAEEVFPYPEGVRLQINFGAT
jgi:hypothetical protein